MPGLERLIYVDDSYNESHAGLIVFGWVECHPVRWCSAHNEFAWNWFGTYLAPRGSTVPTRL